MWFRRASSLGPIPRSALEPDSSSRRPVSVRGGWAGRVGKRHPSPWQGGTQWPREPPREEHRCESADTTAGVEHICL